MLTIVSMSTKILARSKKPASAVIKYFEFGPQYRFVHSHNHGLPLLAALTTESATLNIFNNLAENFFRLWIIIAIVFSPFALALLIKAC